LDSTGEPSGALAEVPAGIPGGKKSLGTRLMSAAGTILGLGLLGLALWYFGRTLQRYDIAEVMVRVKSLPASRLAAAIVFAAMSYAAQAWYDFLAARSVRIPISAGKSMSAAFIGNALTNNIGFSLLTGPSLRLRFYLGWGFSALQTAQLITLSKLAFANGLLLCAGLSQLINPAHLPDSIHLPLSPRVLGALLTLPSVALLAWNGFAKGDTLRFGKFQVARPSQSLLALQIAVSCLHLALASCTLYYLLPTDALAAAGFSGPIAFLGTFMAIKFVVMFVPVPGGLGVFEGTAVALLTPSLPDYPVLGALLGYRLIYYVLAFAVALVALAGYELSARHGALATLLRRRRSSAM
jgi:phosphatidylglycerol lysyltransferase